MNDKDAHKPALLKYRMERGWETLQDARLLLEQGGSTASIINRAYYAMFYAVLGLLGTLGEGAARYEAVISLFDQHFVKSGRFPKEMSKAIHAAFELRQMGDYRELITLDRTRAEKIVHAAQQFLQKADEYLRGAQ